jgi:AraC-like DNA-binding protein
MPAITYELFRSASFPVERAVQPGVLIAARYQRIWRDAQTVERHRLRAWVIDCALTPGLRLRSPTATSPWLERPAGMVHVYAPDTVFWEDNANLCDRRLGGVYLVFSDPGRQLAQLTKPGGGVARVTDATGQLGEALLEPYGEGGTGAPERWRCQTSLVRLIGLLRSARPAADGGWSVGALTSVPDLPTQVDAWFEAHLATRMSVGGLGRHLGLASSTLAHRYRAMTGMSPMRRLAELRVRRLQALLAKGLRLGEAAPDSGFCDAFHASRRFRAVTGLTPTAWLATLRRP